MTDIGRLRGQVSARVFASAVDLRTVDVDVDVDVDAVTATVAATAGADADVAAIDEDTWSRLLDDH